LLSVKGNHVRTFKKAAVLAVAAAGSLAFVAAPAGASVSKAPTYTPPKVNFVMRTVIASSAGKGTAAVYASYRCSSVGQYPGHLYIGVKQGPQINATDHTSSQYAKTFYSTNWIDPDSGGLTPRCDNKEHFQKWILKPDPYWANAANNPPKLKTGPAFVQFCLYDKSVDLENTDENAPPPPGFVYNYAMHPVRVLH
jgi:hypothetical protein